MQNEYDEQASLSWIQRELSDREVAAQRMQMRAPVYNSNASAESTGEPSSVSNTFSNLKSKFINFFTERKGYRRVSTSNTDADADEQNGNNRNRRSRLSNL